jgi:hypothetical protein
MSDKIDQLSFAGEISEPEDDPKPLMLDLDQPMAPLNDLMSEPLSLTKLKHTLNEK